MQSIPVSIIKKAIVPPQIEKQSICIPSDIGKVD